MMFFRKKLAVNEENFKVTLKDRLNKSRKSLTFGYNSQETRNNSKSESNNVTTEKSTQMYGVKKTEEKKRVVKEVKYEDMENIDKANHLVEREIKNNDYFGYIYKIETLESVEEEGFDLLYKVLVKFQVARKGYDFGVDTYAVFYNFNFEEKTYEVDYNNRWGKIRKKHNL